MTINARRKGKRGEYEVRDILTDKFYPEGDGHVERTPMSGAWHGMNVMSGDLIFVKNDIPDPRFPFFWEVKLRKKSTFSPMKMLTGEFGALEGWLDKATAQCGDWSRLIPFVIWRTDFSPWFIYMWGSDFGVQLEWFGPLPESVPTVRNGTNINMPLNDWLNWVNLESLMEKNKEV